jgi:hypothetical protein
MALRAGVISKCEPFTFSLDIIYSGGSRAGFADLEQLPTVVQFNAGAQISFRVPGVGEVIERLTVLNLLDRVKFDPAGRGDRDLSICLRSAADRVEPP